MFLAGRFTLSHSSRICGLFFRVFFVFWEILSTSMFFHCSIYIETAQNSREQCNELADLLFWILWLFLSRDSLWHSLIRSLYFIQIYIFVPLIHSAPFLRFSHVLLYTNFFLCILPREIFSYPWWRCCSEFNFSSQRPHLIYNFLSNVYSLDTMEFSMKHKY